MLALVGMSGSLLIPYLRAKAEGEGVNGKGGLMGRAERLLFLLIGIGLSDWRVCRRSMGPCGRWPG